MIARSLLAIGVGGMLAGFVVATTTGNWIAVAAFGVFGCGMYLLSTEEFA